MIHAATQIGACLALGITGKQKAVKDKPGARLQFEWQEPLLKRHVCVLQGA